MTTIEIFEMLINNIRKSRFSRTEAFAHCCFTDNTPPLYYCHRVALPLID